MRIFSKSICSVLALCLVVGIMSFALAGCGKVLDDDAVKGSTINTEAPSKLGEDGSDEMTAEEAAADEEAIANELADITALINDGLYDDALMSINALLTKNLTDEQKNQVMELKAIVDSKLGQ